jgi:acylglycerol lipase
MDQLFERVWPVEDPKGVVVIVHGLAEHSGRYEHVAQALNRTGYAVHAHDLRGHGNSPGFPGDMGEDVEAIVADVRAHLERVTAAYEHTFCLAHSMGTLFAIPAVTEAPPDTVDGLIVSGVALQPGPAVLESISTGACVPPESISRDPQVVEAYKNDPLVFYDRVPPELLALLPVATQRAGRAIGQVRIPVLIVHGSDDELCSLEGANYLHVQLNLTDKTLRTYKGLYHEVLNEPEREEVIGDIIRWIGERS